MNLTKIANLSTELGLSSRALRYYMEKHLYISGDHSELQRVSCDKAMGYDTDKSGWIFIGEKKAKKYCKNLP